MNHENYSLDYIRDILRSVRTIALVGVSASDVRASYFVFKYLLEKGYDVTPVNPGLGGQEVVGRKVYADLKDIPHALDMVDIFRNAEAASQIVDDALRLTPRPRAPRRQASRWL